MDILDKYWVAGLFEGEGCLSVSNKNRSAGSVTASLAMTDLDVIERLDSIWPGLRYVRVRNNPKHKTIYIWQLNGQRAYDFIKEVYDLLGERRKSKADELISLFESPSANHNIRATRVTEVASLVSQGYNDTMIAKIMNISPSYVGRLRKEGL